MNLVIEEEIVQTVAVRGHGDRPASFTPGPFGRRDHSLHPSGRHKALVELGCHRALGSGVALILGHYRLLPKAGLGILGADEQAPLQALGPALEIAPQAVVPHTVGGTRAASRAVENPRRAAPHGRSPAVSAGSADPGGTGSVGFHLVLVPVGPGPALRRTPYDRHIRV